MIATRCRPASDDGDLLPVSSPADLFSGPAAVAVCARRRLALCAGEWWEDPDDGLDLSGLISRRDPLRHAPAILAALKTYLESGPGDLRVLDAALTRDGPVCRLTCIVLAAPEGEADGTGPVSLTLPLPF